jgi:hypothetical protein
MDARMRQVFFLFILAYTTLYLWMLSLRARVEGLSRGGYAR